MRLSFVISLFLMCVVAVIAINHKGLEVIYDSEYVLVPGAGLRPKSCVYSLPSESLIEPLEEGGHKVTAPTGEIQVIPRCPFALLPNNKKDAVDNGWNVYASWSTPTPKTEVSIYNGNWTVPPAPSSKGGQTIFLFTGMQNMNEGNTEIIQPVLQWGPSAAGGGPYWAIASWYVPVDTSNTLVSPLKNVNAGDLLYGIMEYSSSSSSWTISAIDEKTSVSSTLTLKKNPLQDWCAVTLEAYSIGACGQYPGSDVAFTGLYVVINGKQVSPQWKPSVEYTNCNEKVIIGGPSSVTLSWSNGTSSTTSSSSSYGPSTSSSSYGPSSSSYYGPSSSSASTSSSSTASTSASTSGPSTMSSSYASESAAGHSSSAYSSYGPSSSSASTSSASTSGTSSMSSSYASYSAAGHSSSAYSSYGPSSSSAYSSSASTSSASTSGTSSMSSSYASYSAAGHSSAAASTYNEASSQQATGETASSGAYGGIYGGTSEGEGGSSSSYGSEEGGSSYSYNDGGSSYNEGGSSSSGYNSYSQATGSSQQSSSNGANGVGDTYSTQGSSSGYNSYSQATGSSQQSSSGNGVGSYGEATAVTTTTTTQKTGSTTKF